MCTSMREARLWGPIPWMLLLAVAALGCGDEPGAAQPPGGCGFADTGAGTVTVSAGTAVVLDSLSAKAQNTPAHDTNGQTGGRGTLRFGACGSVGVLLWTTAASGGERDLVFADPTAGGTPELVLAAVSRSARTAVLFYDADCAPLVIIGSRKEGLLGYTRAKPGPWTRTTLVSAADLEKAMGGALSSYYHLDAQQEPGGPMTLLFSATVGGKQVIGAATRAAKAGSAFTVSAYPRPESTDLMDLALATDGTMHAVYRNTKYPCDPCNVDFWHATIASGATSWTAEVVQKGVWGDPDDAFVEAASVALDANGTPHIAAHFTRRVVTGSYKGTELRHYRKVGGSWCGEAIVTANAGYAGKDGSRFTGADPEALIDAGGRLHVLFRDQSVWHDSNGQNEMRGHVRHAVRCGSAWQVTTLLAQQGQTQAANPLEGTTLPLVVVSKDGKTLVMATTKVSWKTDSIHNTDERDATYAAVGLKATVSAN